MLNYFKFILQYSKQLLSGIDFILMFLYIAWFTNISEGVFSKFILTHYSLKYISLISNWFLLISQILIKINSIIIYTLLLYVIYLLVKYFFNYKSIYNYCSFQKIDQQINFFHLNIIGFTKIVNISIISYFLLNNVSINSVVLAYNKLFIGRFEFLNFVVIMYLVISIFHSVFNILLKFSSTSNEIDFS